MKKQLTLLYAFLIAFSFASCSGDKDEEGGGGSSSAPIVGTWKYAGSIDGGTVELETDLEDCDREIFKFSKNMTGKYIDRYCDDADETSTFEWEEYASNRYRLIDAAGNPAPMVIQISEDGKQLYFFEEFVEGSNNNYGDVYKK